MKRWGLIYFGLLNFAVGMAILAAAFGVGGLSWLYATFTPNVSVAAAIDSDREPLPLYKAYAINEGYMSLVSLDKTACQEFFALDKPEAVNWLVLINQLRSRGGQYLILLGDLTRNADTLTAEALNFEIDALKGVFLGTSLRLGVSVEKATEALSSSRLSAEQVQGDTSKLARVNQFQQQNPAPHGLKLREGGLVSEHLQAEGRSMPLVYQWEGDIYASLPLLIALHALEIKLEDVQISLGDELRLSEQHSLPIDATGSVSIESTSPINVSVQNLMSGEQATAPFCLLQDGGQEASLAPCLLQTVHALMGAMEPSPAIVYQPLDTWAFWTILLCLIAETMYVFTWERRRQSIAMLCILGQVLILPFLLAQWGIWMNIFAPLVAVVSVYTWSYLPMLTAYKLRK